MSGEPTETTNDLVVLGADGDPIRTGTIMSEYESYERIIEGHKMAADAARHLARDEREHATAWNKVASAIDFARLQVMNLAGLEHRSRFSETKEARGRKAIAWADARTRFREGLQQASGGMRQMATCHRGVIEWSQFARRIEDMERNLMRIAPAGAHSIKLNGELIN